MLSGKTAILLLIVKLIKKMFLYEKKVIFHLIVIVKIK